MSNASTRLLNIIKSTSESTNKVSSRIVTLEITSLSPLVFKYDKLIIDKDFYVRDKNFSTEDLYVGSKVKALMTNEGQTYYILANKSAGGGGGGTTDYDDLSNKPSINGTTLSGNKTTSDLGITIPTKVSQLTNDSGFITDYTETDPTVPSHVKNITQANINSWNNKSDFSGSYNDLTDKPTIPSKTSDLTNDSGFITKSVNDLTYYTLATNTGSTIDLSINSSTYVMTLDLKNSAGTIISTDTIDLPLESMVVSGSYDATNKKIILTLQSGSTIEFSVADLVSGLQTEITSTNKLSSDLVDDTNHTNKFVTAGDITNWNAKGTYSKPSDGIPKSDLSMSVQASLEAADTAVQGTDILDVERTGNKVTSISSSSTNRQYPTAKLLYDQLLLKQDKLTAGTNITIDANNVISASGGGGGTSDYTDLTNKPSINSVTLSGNKTSADLGLPIITYGTTDLNAGVSELSAGELYFWYE